MKAPRDKTARKVSAPRQVNVSEQPAPRGDEWREQLQYTTTPTGGSVLRRSIDNAALILSNHPAWRGVLAFDLFGGRIVKLRPPPCPELFAPTGGTKVGDWTDDDDSLAAVWLTREEGLTLATKTVAEAVRIAARRRSFHPVRQYLDALKWDGTMRLDNWLSAYCGAEDSAYTRQVGKWFLMSAVARAYKPGCQVHTMLILEGEQGAGKSTALRTLAGEWFSDTPIDVGSKDAMLSLRRKWIVEWAELDSLSRAESSRVKAFVSSPSDNYRKPYGREPEDVPRQCVFAGTVNPEGSGYLKDATGGRRFWPVRCGEIRTDKLRADRDQLWAEAVHALNLPDARWWPVTPEEIALCEAQQDERYQRHPWQDPIANWLDARADKHEPVTTSEVLSKALGIEAGRREPKHEIDAGKCLTKLGWKRRQRRVEGRQQWAYFPPSAPRSESAHGDAPETTPASDAPTAPTIATGEETEQPSPSGADDTKPRGASITKADAMLSQWHAQQPAPTLALHILSVLNDLEKTGHPPRELDALCERYGFTLEAANPTEGVAPE